MSDTLGGALRAAYPVEDGAVRDAEWDAGFDGDDVGDDGVDGEFDAPEDERLDAWDAAVLGLIFGAAFCAGGGLVWFAIVAVLSWLA